MRVVYIALDSDKKPIAASDTIEGIREYLDDYCGATEEYNNRARFVNYQPHTSKYPSDYEGMFIYEECLKDDDWSKGYDTLNFFVFCIDINISSKTLRRV